MITSVDVLRRARNLYGRAPSHAAALDLPVEGTYCPITAISTALGPNLGWRGYTDQLAQAAGLNSGEHPISVVRWNAKASTEEVLAAFDRAIAQAEDA